MSKMRKEYDPNKVKRRKRKPIVYIICEGKETETLYFKHFRSRNCLVDIIPIPSKHKAAEHLVKHAKSLISQADYYPKDGDQLWCVFDCDDNKDSELQAAISYAEKHGYKIAYSNPAFEYWYLLHFEKRNGYLKDSATVIDILKNKGYLENYGKSVDVFEELQEHQPEAIQYAKERVERLTRDQVAVILVLFNIFNRFFWLMHKRYVCGQCTLTVKNYTALLNISQKLNILIRMFNFF